MYTLTTTIQEITLTANAHGVFDFLFNVHNMSRDEILNIFEGWGKEYEELAKTHEADDDWFYYEEMDEFVDRKFTEIKLADEFVEGDYIVYATGLYKITGFTARGILVDEIRPRKDADDWVVTEIGLSQVKDITLVSGEEIMDTTQNHDPDLVRNINQAWNEKREMFFPIMCALYKRDNDEILASDAFADWEKVSKDYDTLYEYMEANWDIEAYNYLQHIADDTDLECILNYLHAQ